MDLKLNQAMDKFAKLYFLKFCILLLFEFQLYSSLD